MKKLSVFFILVLITISPSILSAQGKTVNIKIEGKQYIPPPKTPKIPQEFKEHGVRFVVKAGDLIRICNAGKVICKPFSYDKINHFEGLSEPGGLHPGNCMVVKAQNPGNKPIYFRLFDEIHARIKLFMIVVPSNWPNEGEEDTPPGAEWVHPNDEYGLSDNGEIIDDHKNQKTPCSMAMAGAFSRMTGSWNSYALKLTISGSCAEASGTMEWVEWCSGVSDKNNKEPRYPGTFKGEMNGETLVMKWSIPAKGPHKDQSGTAYCSVNYNGTLITCSGFGCGNGELKKD